MHIKQQAFISPSKKRKENQFSDHRVTMRLQARRPAAQTR